MEGEGEKVHGGEQHGEAVCAVSKVVFEAIAVVFQNVESLVFDLPAGSGADGNLGGIGLGDAQAGDEGAFVDDLAFGAGGGEGDEVDRHGVQAVAQGHGIEPAVMDGLALGPEFFGDGEFVRLGTGDEVMERLVAVGLAGEDEIGAVVGNRLRDGLTGEEIVAEIDRLEASQGRAVGVKPALGGSAFAILLVVPVPGLRRGRLWGSMKTGMSGKVIVWPGATRVAASMAW